MHLFCHLFIAFLLDLRRPLVFDRLYTPLKPSFSIIRKNLADILAYLSFFLFLVLHLLLLCLHGCHCCPPCGALFIRGLARRWAEGGLLGVPLLACTTVNPYTLSDNRYVVSSYHSFVVLGLLVRILMARNRTWYPGVCRSNGF